MTTNEFERRARERKVCAIVAVLSSAFDGAGISADDAAGFTPEQREMASAVASEREHHRFGPPSDDTWELVVSSLRVREADRRRAPDPFAGLSR